MRLVQGGLLVHVCAQDHLQPLLGLFLLETQHQFPPLGLGQLEMGEDRVEVAVV